MFERGGDASVPYPWTRHIYLCDEDTEEGLASDVSHSAGLKVFRVSCSNCDGHPAYYDYEPVITEALSAEDTLRATHTLEYKHR